MLMIFDNAKSKLLLILVLIMIILIFLKFMLMLMLDVLSRFLVSRYNEFYIKFELTDELVEKYDNDSDTHIFQVNLGKPQKKSS